MISPRKGGTTTIRGTNPWGAPTGLPLPAGGTSRENESSWESTYQVSATAPNPLSHMSATGAGTAALQRRARPPLCRQRSAPPAAAPDLPRRRQRSAPPAAASRALPRPAGADPPNLENCTIFWRLSPLHPAGVTFNMELNDFL